MNQYQIADHLSRFTPLANTVVLSPFMITLPLSVTYAKPLLKAVLELTKLRMVISTITFASLVKKVLDKPTV
jgi:hypothetical protein